MNDKKIYVWSRDSLKVEYRGAEDQGVYYNQAKKELVTYINKELVCLSHEIDKLTRALNDVHFNVNPEGDYNE